MNLTYDLGRCPASWDFLQWLVNCRLALGLGEFGVHFRPGPKGGFRDDTMARPLDQRRAILENVMRPALKLVGAHEVEEGLLTNMPYLTRYAVDFERGGGEVPYFDIPQEALDEVAHDLKGRKPLVITLREAAYYTERNSNLPAWMEFARTCGEDVIFVRDSSKADEYLEGLETCSRASRDLLYRAALMRHAKCNLMVANGPWVLALYSPTPWLNFGALRPSLTSWRPGSDKWWINQMGVPPGEQFPWATSEQRMIWTDDSLENIWDAYAAKSSRAA